MTMTQGKANARVSSALADDLELRDVAFDANVTVRTHTRTKAHDSSVERTQVAGANSFKNGLMLQHIDIVGSTPTEAVLRAEIVVVNNSSVSCRPGPFTLGVFVDGVYVGNASAQHAYLAQGTSLHRATG